MDESSFLSQITAFFQSALSFATPGNAPSVNPSGVPNTGSATDSYDLSGAGAVTAMSGNWLSNTQGNFNQDFNFLSNTFANSQNFLAQTLSPINTGLNNLGQGLVSAQLANAKALDDLAKSQKKGKGVFGEFG